MANEAFFMLSSGPEELEISLEAMQMTPVQNNNISHQQSTEKPGSGPPSPTQCYYDPSFEDIARHQCTDIDLNLLEDKLKHGDLITQTTNHILPINKVFDNDAPPAEWASKPPGHAVTCSESIHQMSSHTISQTKCFRFVQLNKGSTPKPRATTTRVACVPKGCPKRRSKTTKSINQTSKTSDTKSDVIIPILPVGVKNTPPSAGDAKECEVTSQNQVRRHDSTSRKKRRGRKEGSTSKSRTVGQSGDHRQAAFAEALPPAARTLDIQWLGSSKKCWQEIESTVKYCHLKEERLILRLLRLERLQHLTIEAERKRPGSANPVKPRPKPVEVLGPWPYRQNSSDQADRKTRASVASSRPASAYSCFDASTTHQRKSALVDAADRKSSVDGLSKCIRELNTRDRVLPSGSSRSNSRYAWLSTLESKTLTTLP